MTTETILAHPGDAATRASLADPADGVITRPAGATVIKRTSTGGHELQVLDHPCAAHDGGIPCPHPATTIIGARGFRQDRPDERRGAQFCAIHGFERLGQLDPLRTRGVA